MCLSQHRLMHFYRRAYSTPPSFFFNDTATPEISPLSLHDALPISGNPARDGPRRRDHFGRERAEGAVDQAVARSEEHTSELQSQSNLVCRLLLQKKKQQLWARGHAASQSRTRCARLRRARIRRVSA